MESLKQFLSQHPFFHGFLPKHLETIVGCASNVRFDPEQYLFREGDTARQFFLIRHGAVSLETGISGCGPINIETISENQVLGWSWLFPPHRWHFDARALELTRAIAMDTRCLLEKKEVDLALGYTMVRRFAQLVEQRLQATRLRMTEIHKQQKLMTGLPTQSHKKPVAPTNVLVQKRRQPPPNSVENLLRAHPFFHDLQPEHLDTLVDCATFRQYRANQQLFAEGEAADHFYLVMEGEVALEVYFPDNNVLTIERVKEGQVFGWSWLFPPYLWHFNARTIQPARLIVMDGKCLRAKKGQDMEMGYSLMERFARVMEQRLQATRRTLSEMYEKLKKIEGEIA